MSAPGTTKGILRSLQHMQPPTKGSKFAIKAPTHAAHRPKFVQPKDRIPFWNIVPGDHVKLRHGRVGQNEGLDQEKVRGEGVVLSIDREKNWIWLRDVDEKNKLAPKSLRHIVPRLIDPTDPSKGYGPNVTEIPRPVHYSKVMLKIPGTDQYAKRLSRSSAYYDKRKGMYIWKRYATIKASEEKAKETGKLYEKVEVPWPKIPERRRILGPGMSDSHAVEDETWAPWRPEDPVFLRWGRQHSSVESENRAKLLTAQREELDRLKKGIDPSVVPEDAEGTYAGFKDGKPKPPPIAQPPTPSETLRAQNKKAAQWARQKDVEAHRQDGGLTFMYRDYLDVTPLSGPASGGDWTDLPASTSQGGLDGPRERGSGRLIHGVSKDDADRMPIELLMKGDLVNERGLKWRMRRWKADQERKRAREVEIARERKELHKELEVLKL